jgi:hypothetical protein
MVLLSQSTISLRERTLLVLDNLDIAPTDKCDFVGLLELEQRPIKPNWLGLAGERAFLTFAVQEPGPVRTGILELSSGLFVEDAPLAGWFRSWSIALPGSTEPEIIYEMKSPPK